ncbi:MAG: DUF1853 family protein [Bdellovibrionales bacterium]|nr:DUF1853 family protein [Bdellovibrionales bacterium]
MPYAHLAEWEWGWKTPLLLRLSGPDGEAPPAVRDFLSTPLDRLALADAETTLAARIAELNTYRIGVYFERVQEALFRAHPDTTSLRTSLIVPGRTEIDLLHRIRALPGTAIHWEVAVKYYLGLDEGGATDPDRYVGPSLKDTLGVKMRTIFGRQLPILGDESVRANFGGPFGIAPEETVLRFPKVHGALYAPFRRRNEVRRPEAVAPDSARGAWCTYGELPEFLASVAGERGKDAHVRWMRDRYDWLRETVRLERPEEETPLKDYLKSSLAARWESHFTGSGGSLADPLHATIHGDRRELRFFVVGDGWREAAVRKLETLRAESRIKA